MPQFQGHSRCSSTNKLALPQALAQPGGSEWPRNVPPHNNQSGAPPGQYPFTPITEESHPNLDILGDVIITGGAGFLGRHLANSLATAGRRTVLDDLSCSNSTFDCPELLLKESAALGDQSSTVDW